MPVEIAHWLAQLNLAQYTQTFVENDIQSQLLPELTDADLRELGVVSLGHRKILLQAIAELKLQPAAPAHHLQSEAERRQLTVMFCDLADSTALSQRLDPEDLRDVNRAYQDRCKHAVEEFGGYVARYMGDGVLAYFGYPMAHEDDPERAIRAGLAIVGAMYDLQHAVEGVNELAVRVGIATGAVVVGDLIGEGASQESAVVGETPNLAARLQGMAEHNAVVIAPSTRLLAGRVFDYEDLGVRKLKGIAEPVRASRVVRESAVESRFEALRGGRLTPLVGRDQELNVLMACWQLAAGGKGQFAMLGGEPGIGKSRIAEALIERVSEDTHHRVRCYCSPHAITSALYPLIAWLGRAAGLQRDDAPCAKLDKIEALAQRQDLADHENLALIAALLSIPADARCAELALTPAAQKVQTFNLLVRLLISLSVTGPVLLVLEDAHWLDPTSTEFFAMLLNRIQDRRVLLLITHRPEFAPHWDNAETPSTSLTLNRLDPHLGSMIVEQVARKHRLPDELIRQIVTRSDGVPLFVEELTKTILESQAAREADGGVGQQGIQTVPATLHDSLMYRLDRQAEAKEVALIGSVIGREFDFELLARVASLPGEELESALNRLVESELILRRGESRAATYVFKHALVQDTAYQSLLKSRKRQLHARVATVIETHFPQRSESQPELLAEHFTAANDVVKAIPYWMTAGYKALLGWSLAESVSHYTSALELTATIKDEETRAATELDVRTGLGTATMALHGWPAPKVREVAEPACALFDQGYGSTVAFQNFWNLWLHYGCRAEHREGLAVVARMLKLASERGDPTMKLVASFTASIANFWVGNYREAVEHETAALGLYDFERDGGLVWTHNHDPRNTLLSWGANRVWALGFPDQARALADQAVAHARRCGHHFNLCWTLGNSSIARGQCGEYEQAQQSIQELRRIAQEQELLFIEHYLASSVNSQLALRVGKYEEAYEQGWQGQNTWQAVGGRFYSPVVKACIAEVCIYLNRVEEAVDLIDSAVADVESTGEFMVAEEIYRVAGLVHVAKGEARSAEALFDRSLDFARKHDTRSYELRTAMSLARLWSERGERQAAVDLLRPVYDWFTEGFDTADLRDARKLLSELT